MAMNRQVDVELHNATRSAVLRLNRPEVSNALSPTLALAIAEHVRALAASGVATIRMETSSKNFCAGFDLKSDSVGAEDLLESFPKVELLLQTVRLVPVVTIAHVRGAAIGAGADLAIANTFRVGTAEVTFAFPGFNYFGVSLGTEHLVSTVGRDAARDLLLTARRVGGEEAHEIGLLTHLVDSESHAEEVVADLTTAASGFDRMALGQLLQLTQDPRSEGGLGPLQASITRQDVSERMRKKAR